MTQKRRTIITIGGFLAVYLGATVVAVGPLLSSVQQEAAEKARHKAEQNRVQEQLAVYKQFRAEHTSGKQAQKQIERQREVIAALQQKLDSEEIESSSAQLSERITEEQRKLEQLRKKLADQSATTTNPYRINALFADPAAPVSFISEVETSAAATGISVDITALGNPGEQSDTLQNLNTMNFKIEANAPFPQLAAFIERVEHLPFLVQIQSASIEQEEDNGRNPSMSAIMRVYAR